MIGDVLFYKNGSSWGDKVIAWYEHSDIVHCSVQVSDTEMIEALSGGIEMNHLREPAIACSIKEHSSNYDEQDLRVALDWLRSMVGNPYGWIDIANAANPLQKYLYFVAPNYYDCSALTIVYLDKVGGIDLKGMELDPHRCTPIQIAKTLHVA